MSTTTITIGTGSIGSSTDLTLSGAYNIDVEGFGGRLNVTNGGTPPLIADIVTISGEMAPFTDYVSTGADEIFDPTGSYFAPGFVLGGDPSQAAPPGGGTLELGNNLASEQVNLNVTLSGLNNELIVDSSLTPSIFFAIDGFDHTDTINLQGITGATTAAWTQNAGAAGGILALDSASGTELTALTLATGTFSSSLFSITTDSTAGTDITVACYRDGTRIATPSGEVPVESLAIGDPVLTADGSAKPVKWLGKRAYSGRFAAGKAHLLPIRFRPGALGNGRPRRDLWVSPQHAMLIDGALVPAICLTNGISIIQETDIDRIEYIHVELAAHDVIFAEGAASETYVNDDNRTMFHNAPDYTARYCATRLDHGAELETIRARLSRLADATSPAAPPTLNGWLERIIYSPEATYAEGWAQDQTRPEAPICIEILANNRIVARGLANLYRPDLEDARLGSGRHAFRIVIPRSCPLNSLIARRAGDSTQLSISPALRAA